MKFDSLFTETLGKLDEAPMPPEMTAPVAQAPEPAPAPVQQKLTPEGKRFMIELALRALAFDPNSIPDTEKGIFDEPITAENADSILSRIEQMIAVTSVDRATDSPSSEDDIA